MSRHSKTLYYSIPNLLSSIKVLRPLTPCTTTPPMPRVDIELHPLPSLILLLCCILPQIEREPQRPQGVHIGCCPRLSASTSTPSRRNSRAYWRQSPSKYSSPQRPVSHIPPSIRRNPQAPNANVVEVRPGHRGGASINVVEVTPEGAVIAHAEPRGGAGGGGARGGGTRGGNTHVNMSPISEDGSYTSSSSSSEGVTGMYRGPLSRVPGFRSKGSRSGGNERR